MGLFRYRKPHTPLAYTAWPSGCTWPHMHTSPPTVPNVRFAIKWQLTSGIWNRNGLRILLSDVVPRVLHGLVDYADDEDDNVCVNQQKQSRLAQQHLQQRRQQVHGKCSCSWWNGGGCFHHSSIVGAGIGRQFHLQRRVQHLDDEVVQLLVAEQPQEVQGRQPQQQLRKPTILGRVLRFAVLVQAGLAQDAIEQRIYPSLLGTVSVQGEVRSQTHQLWLPNRHPSIVSTVRLSFGFDILLK
uniref:Uncharacterized protein n=1 Tax=Anopheles farauti TaxID=69004 RepID=A0A182QVG5_9DIPT